MDKSDMDQQISFETLSAYLDGELDETSARDVEERLAQDEKAWSHVRMLREFDGALASALSAPTHEQPPSRLIDAIDDEFAARAKRKRFAVPPFPLPIAASIAVAAVAGLAGYIISDYLQGSDADLALRAEQHEHRIFTGTVNRALETKLSGQPVSWSVPETGKRGEITPIRTFRTKSGHWCREYRVQVNSEGQTRSWHGIACRTPTDGWITVEERFYP